MTTKFSIVVSDPAWSFADKLEHSDVKRGADANYQTMSLQDIKELPISQIADPTGALLALWVPSSMLQDGLDVMKAYNFQHRQTYIWVKSKKNALKKSKDLNDTLGFGMGRVFRNCHEICLIGINNNGIYKKLKNKSQRTVSLAENLKHSAKPSNLQDSLDLMFPDTTGKIELFARNPRQGWITIGNECAGTSFGIDIRESLKKYL